MKNSGVHHCVFLIHSICTSIRITIANCAKLGSLNCQSHTLHWFLTYSATKKYKKILGHSSTNIQVSGKCWFYRMFGVLDVTIGIAVTNFWHTKMSTTRSFVPSFIMVRIEASTSILSLQGTLTIVAWYLKFQINVMNTLINHPNVWPLQLLVHLTSIILWIPLFFRIYGLLLKIGSIGMTYWLVLKLIEFIIRKARVVQSTLLRQIFEHASTPTLHTIGKLPRIRIECGLRL